MFILLVFAAGLLIALLRGGRLVILGQLQIRYLWMAFVPLAIQLFLFTPLSSPLHLDETAVRLFYLVSMGLAAVLLLLNHRIPGIKWIAAGLALNLLVITLNGGLMPVSLTARQLAGMEELAGRDNNVIPITSATLLPWLADVIPIPSSLPFPNVYSVGDLLITVGGLVFTQKALFPQGSAPADSRRISPWQLALGLALGHSRIAVGLLLVLILITYGLVLLLLTNQLSWHL